MNDQNFRQSRIHFVFAEHKNEGAIPEPQAGGEAKRVRKASGL
jgi:hypothetical protein